MASSSAFSRLSLISASISRIFCLFSTVVFFVFSALLCISSASSAPSCALLAISFAASSICCVIPFICSTDAAVSSVLAASCCVVAETSSISPLSDDTFVSMFSTTISMFLASFLTLARSPPTDCRMSSITPARLPKSSLLSSSLCGIFFEKSPLAILLISTEIFPKAFIISEEINNISTASRITITTEKPINDAASFFTKDENSLSCAAISSSM